MQAPAATRVLKSVVLMALVVVGGAGCVATIAPSRPPGSGASSLDPAEGWQLVINGDAGRAASFSAVIATSSGFVAAGLAGPAGNKAMILDSADGRKWTAEPIEARSGVPGVLVPWGTKVLGFAGTGESRCAHPHAMDTWARDARGAWTEAPFDPLFCAGAGNGTLLVHKGSALLIGAGSGDNPYDLTSDDGLHWVDHPHAYGDNLYPRVVATDGTWVWLFGSATNDRQMGTRSADGVKWESPSPVAGIGPGSAVRGAVVLDGRLKVFATAAAGTMGVLELSPEGGWVSAPAIGIRGDYVARFAVVGHHLLATGSDENGLPLAWVSADGVTWSPLRLPAEAGSGTTFAGAAVANGVAVLVGQITQADGSGVGAIWIGSPALLMP